MTDDSPRDDLAAAFGKAVNDGTVVVCLTKCWSCMFGEHHEPPKWHTWADDEDIEHARQTGQPDPRSSRCGCSCAVVPPSSVDEGNPDV